MAIGDGTDSTAAGMAVVLGTELANKIDFFLTGTRDYIANGPVYWKPGVYCPAARISGKLAIANGGTGSDNAADARTALGITAANIPTGTPGSSVQDGLNFLATTKADASALASKATLNANVTFGHIYTPVAVAADFGYTIGYINGDGRISKGASAAKYKDDITPVDPMALGDIFPQLNSFVMKDDPGRMVRYGHIADQMDANPDQRPFVVYERTATIDVDGNVTGYHRIRDENGNFVPESIDFIAHMQAMIAQLHARDLARQAEIADLRAELAELKGGI